MATDAELALREREVAVQEADQQLKLDQFKHEKSKGPLANVAVTVTIVAGVAAIAFQGLGAWSAGMERHAASDRLAAATKQADNDWDFRGLELFVHDEDKLVGCDPKAAQQQVDLFATLFPRLVQKIQTAASSKAQACATDKSNAAAAAAAKENAPAAKVEAAADAARYDTLTNFASSVPVPKKTGLGPIRTVYIQIADESQRPQAVALQQALIAKGYSAPGVQLVAAAPAQAQLRVYRNEEVADGDKVASFVGSTLATQAPAVKSLEGRFRSLPPGVAEYWFPAS